MIKDIRERLELSQEQAGELIGGGPRAFQKYETGEVRPAASVEKLLLLLNQAPKLAARLKSPGVERTSLPPALAVADIDIVSFSPRDLQDTLRTLIIAEANAYNLEHSWLHVPSEVNAPDGGEDGRFSWIGSVNSTRHLKARTVVFQSKATAMSTAKCINEMMSGAQLKPRIKAVLEAGGAYTLVVSRLMTQKDLDQRLNAMREHLRKLGHPKFAERVYVYSASQIADWANNYPAAALAIRDRLGHADAFRAFDAWSRRTEHSIAFQEDDRLKAISGDILSRLKANQSVVRMVGLSGRGKSRLAVETFSLPSSDAQRLRSKLIYADAGGSDHDVSIINTMQRLIDQKAEALVVVENCTPKTHARLSSMVRGEPNRLSLLTIDLDTTEVVAAETIFVNEMSDGTTDRLVQAIAPKLNEIERRRIVKYSAGFPQMARLLAEAAANDKNLASCSDLHLARMFVLGRGGDHHGTTLLVARFISLFGLVRIEGDDEQELKHLHQAFKAPAAEVFRRHVRWLIARGVAQRRGGLVMVAPRPIALALAMDLWSEWSTSQVKAAFLMPENQRLHRMMLRQFARLDGYPEAVTLATAVLDVDGLFDKQETLFSIDHTEAISALSEVAPEPAVTLLEKLFDGCSDDCLKAVKGDARRNLVWMLGKLAFRKETFERATWLLLSLAVAENETWGNNATGTFKGLFPIVFADTEAGLSERVRVIRRALKTNSQSKLSIAVEAVDRALETGHFSRVVGLEMQGSRRFMQCWQPTTIAEQRQYFSTFLRIQTNLACRPDAIGEIASKTLGRRLFGLIQIGMIDEVEATVAHIQKKRKNVWVAAIDSLRHLLAHPEKSLSPEIERRTRKLLSILQPTDLRNELRLAVTEAPWDFFDDDEDKVTTLSLSEKMSRRATELAQRIAPNPSKFEPLLPNLLRGEQRQAFAFGSVLIRNVENRKRILHSTLAALKEIQGKERNISLIGGMVHALAEEKDDLADAAIAWFDTDAEFFRDIPYLIAVAGVSAARLPRVVELAQIKAIPAWCFTQFGYGRALEGLSPEEASPLFVSLIRSGDDYRDVAIELIGMYVLGRHSILDNLRPVLRELYDRLSKNALSRKRGGMSGHHLNEITKWLLAKGSCDELACHAAMKIAEHLTLEKDEAYDYDGTNQEMVRALLRHFGPIVWSIISEPVLGRDARALRLAYILGERMPFQENQNPPILEMPSPLLFAWCRTHPDDGPAFLARVLPILENKTSEPTQHRTWHPLVRSLIDEFGKSAKFRDAIRSSMHTFGWSGSLTTYYALYLQPLQDLINHPIDEVRLWATTELARLKRTISSEHTWDAEQEADWEV